MESYRKSVAAVLAAVVTILAGFGLDIRAWATPEILGTISSALGALLVYWLPNDEGS